MQKKIIFVVVLAFMIGSVVGQLEMILAHNCEDIPSFHIFYLAQIKSCLQDEDRRLDNRMDVSDSVFTFKLSELEDRIDNITRGLN